MFMELTHTVFDDLLKKKNGPLGRVPGCSSQTSFHVSFRVGLGKVGESGFVFTASVSW